MKPSMSFVIATYLTRLVFKFSVRTTDLA